MKVRLLSHEGQFIADIELPPFLVLPEVVVWGLGTRVERDPQLARIILERVENNEDWGKPR